jgi:hypothetical protein
MDSAARSWTTKGHERTRKSRKAFAFFVSFRVFRGPNIPALVLDLCSVLWYTEFNAPGDTAVSGGLKRRSHRKGKAGCDCCRW